MSYATKYAGTVKNLLLQRADLTHATMIELGCGWRLAAVIHYLRGKGWKIETVLDGRRVAHYRLETGWTPEKLDAPQAANLGGVNAK